MRTFREPPDGWFTFGTHVDRPVQLEFSDEVDDGGMPLWERPNPRRMIVPLPWRVPPLRANDRRSWPAQHRAFQQALTEARWAVRAARLTPVVGAEVTLHYRPSTRRRQDADGIAPTLKPCLDALVLEGVLPDDSWVHVSRTAQEFHEPNGEPAALWLTLAPPDGEEFQSWGGVA